MEQHLAMDEVGEGAVPVTSLSLEPGQARGIGTTLRASPAIRRALQRLIASAAASRIDTTSPVISRNAPVFRFSENSSAIVLLP